MYHGNDILTVASRHLGEAYVLGATPLLANADWSGPWDCAEFAAWCAYQAYGIIFAVRPPDPRLGESYSGWWAEDALAQGCAVDAAVALCTPGALLVRRPRVGIRTGHVAISMGDGTTIEAKDTATGVAIVQGAAGRPWDLGVQLPGVIYAPCSEADRMRVPPPLIQLCSPYMRGPEVLVLQRRLAALGVSPGRVDGHFGPMTHAAVQTFQAMRGLVADGIVGPDTAQALDLGWPIMPDAQDCLTFESLAAQPFSFPAPPIAKEDDDIEPRPPHADPSASRPAQFEFLQKNDGRHYATSSTGREFYLGKETSYRDDMARVGLSQGASRLLKNGFAPPYDPIVFAKDFPLWSHFIYPTVMAESGGFFERVNSYDRAAFTFGCYQFAAHTPGDNLILLFRSLLDLPAASMYFPDLFLQKDALGGKIVMRRLADGRTQNLEAMVNVLRPNGKQEQQLKHFMDYLNPDSTALGPEELLAAARLMLWTGEDEAARKAQVALAAATARRKLQATAKKLPVFDPGNWEAAIWVSDIRHQGRGTYAAIEAALQSAAPLEALSAIGNVKYADRLSTVKQYIAEIKTSGVMGGWTWPV